MAFEIKTDAFEGPLELLLDLIEKNKHSINTVSLAAITDEYMAEVKSRAAVAPDEIAQFLVVASTLLLIKSRSLLPQLPVTEEEEASMYDLEERLRRLRGVRELARRIAERVKQEERMYAREGAADIPAIFYPPEGFTRETMHTIAQSIRNALRRAIEQAVTLPEHTLQKTISLEERIGDLIQRVEKTLTTSFRSFVGGTAEKTDIIVSFLALLELVKQGTIAAHQQDVFGDITISHQQ